MRAVVDLSSQHAFAEVRPVGPRVDEMQVPDLLHDLRGDQWRRGYAEEIDELLVLVDRRSRLFGRPAASAGHAHRERKFTVGTVDIEALDALPEVAIRKHDSLLFMQSGARAVPNLANTAPGKLGG